MLGPDAAVWNFKVLEHCVGSYLVELCISRYNVLFAFWAANHCGCSRNHNYAKKAGSCTGDPAPEVTAHHSGSLSHCWGHRTVLPALLPAWANAHVIINQDITVSTMVPLSSALSVGASHQHSQQDIIQIPALHQPAPTWVTGGSDSPQLIEKKSPCSERDLFPLLCLTALEWS